VNSTDHAWQRTQFERWFDVHPYLPGGERILVVGRHQQGRRAVALVALDGEGGLVILEVSDGPSGRRSVGAALEYLAHYEDATLDALLDDDEAAVDALRDAFRATFGAEPSALGPRRRVLLVAPSHGSYAAVCANYLSRHLTGETTVGLLKATTSAAGFILEDYDASPLRRAAALGPTFAVSVRGRLYYVLEPGPAPVVWSVGRIRARDGAVEVKGKPPRRALKLVRWPLMPIGQPDQVDLSGTGTVWMQRERNDRLARVLGTVREPARGDVARSYVVFAAFRLDEPRGFRMRPAEEFFRRWEPSDRPLPGWAAIARAQGARVMRPSPPSG
jgi:hypothetical protein